MSHEDQMDCDRPDMARPNQTRMTGVAEVDAMREARAMDPEAAAINAIVTRLDNIDTNEGVRRILEFCVNRYLGQSLDDDGR